MLETQSQSVKEISIKKLNNLSYSAALDFVSIEEPLEISINYGKESLRISKTISVTMRTPGNDDDLALGFLFTEGIISSFEQINGINKSLNQNVISVDLSEDFIPNLKLTERNFYTTSSCGVCGKSSIESIKTVNPFVKNEKKSIELPLEILYHLPEKLKLAQGDFANTGGIHASGLFNKAGELLLLKEDVGRHNALDKLIGNALINKMLPLDNHILLLSGRASFELIQKAAMAGIQMVVAIGAPSSLAIELAQEYDMTLMGFLREKSCNIYHLGQTNLISENHLAI